ncbi:hypothetical protein HN682_03370 [Candidatus Peregrinibacteria bacterium]|nr:hypothetical protein [Candidatus Peregrinibacteria bacterium]
MTDEELKKIIDGIKANPELNDPVFIVVLELFKKYEILRGDYDLLCNAFNDHKSKVSSALFNFNTHIINATVAISTEGI